MGRASEDSSSDEDQYIKARVSSFEIFMVRQSVRFRILELFSCHWQRQYEYLVTIRFAVNGLLRLVMNYSYCNFKEIVQFQISFIGVVGYSISARDMVKMQYIIGIYRFYGIVMSKPIFKYRINVIFYQIVTSLSIIIQFYVEM